METDKYAIVIPFYDGLDTIQELVFRIHESLARLQVVYRVFLVDDSADKKKSTSLNQFFCNDFRVEILTLKMNFGQHYATLEGMKVASDYHVITLDEDLQHLPEDIPKFIQLHQNHGYQVIYGSRIRKDRRFWIGKLILKFFFRQSPDTTSSFRLLDKSVVEDLLQQKPFVHIVDGMIFWQKPSYGYVNVAIGSTGRGQSTYTFWSASSLVVNLITFYGVWPLVSGSVFALLIQVFAILIDNNPLIITSLPFSILGAIILVNYFHTKRRIALLHED